MNTDAVTTTPVDVSAAPPNVFGGFLAWIGQEVRKVEREGKGRRGGSGRVRVPAVNEATRGNHSHGPRRA